MTLFYKCCWCPNKKQNLKKHKGHSPEHSAKLMSKNILGRLDFQEGELQMTGGSTKQLFPIILQIHFYYETKGVLIQVKIYLNTLKDTFFRAIYKIKKI